MMLKELLSIYSNYLYEMELDRYEYHHNLACVESRLMVLIDESYEADEELMR